MLTAAFHFDVTELWVRSEMLGQVFNTSRCGHDCRLIFPADDTSFGMPGATRSPFTGSSAQNTREGDKFGLSTVRVEIELATDINGEDIPWGGPFTEASDTALEALQKPLERAADIARSLVADLLAAIRVDFGQYWLNPQFAPPQISWMTELTDQEGRRLGTGYRDPFGPAVIGRHRDAIGSGDVAAVLSQVEARRTPSLPGVMLADAMRITHGTRSGNHALAILLAAMSAEVGIKQFLRANATAVQSQLLDLILVDRMVSLAAASLYDRALKATVGHSLREDDRVVFNSVSKLFEARNGVAHRGTYVVSKDEAAKHVLAARAAARYLDGLTPPGR